MTARKDEFGRNLDHWSQKGSKTKDIVGTDKKSTTASKGGRQR